jgi:uncharacterized protein YndB with AHSA1/START domain
MNNRYHFVTHWRLAAAPDSIFDLICHPLDFPRWWGAVYLAATTLRPADIDGTHGKVAFHTKGRLPYTLRWTSETTEARRPSHLSLRATGDLEGRGTWTLQPDGDFTDVTFDWQLSAEKPLLRFGSVFLKPLFAWNHRWAMEQGRIGIERELKRLASAAPKALPLSFD